jgi:hypothetical protein
LVIHGVGVSICIGTQNTLESSAVAEIVDGGARMDADGVSTATGDNGVGFTLMLPPGNFVEQVVDVTKQRLVSCAAVTAGTLAGVEFTGTTEGTSADVAARTETMAVSVVVMASFVREVVTVKRAPEISSAEVGVEVASSRLEQQRSGTMATLTLDGVDAAVGTIVYSAEAVVRPEQFVEHDVGGRAARFPSRTAHASRKAVWRLAIFSAHTGSRLALSSASSMRRLPASPNELVRRLAVSSADSSTEAYIDRSKAFSTAACTVASMDDTSSIFQSMELDRRGVYDLEDLWNLRGWNYWL